jgi:hypothetical protein
MELEADHFPRSSTKVMKVFRYTSALPYVFLVWQLINNRGNFTILPLPINYGSGLQISSKKNGNQGCTKVKSSLCLLKHHDKKMYVGVLKSLWLLIVPIFLFAAKPKEFFLDRLKKLEQRSHKCVELKEDYVEQIHFFNPVACCFLYKVKDLSAPTPLYGGAEV